MTELKRICLALGNVKVEDTIANVVKTRYRRSYEVAENVRSKEALISALNREKFDVLILREDLTGNIDLIDLFKMIRQGNNDLQIIFFMNHRENGDPFYVELFLFNVYDFVILPEIDLNVVFSFLEHPRRFRDILRYLPVRAERIRNLIVEANTDMQKPPKLSTDGDIDDVVEINIHRTPQKPPIASREESVPRPRPSAMPPEQPTTTVESPVPEQISGTPAAPAPTTEVGTIAMNTNDTEEDDA